MIRSGRNFILSVSGYRNSSDPQSGVLENKYRRAPARQGAPEGSKGGSDRMGGGPRWDDFTDFAS